MTKNEKRNLTWKLKELPTASELADLVDSGVIKAEEAREMVFGSVQNDKGKIEALEKMVEFLQGLVTELSKNRSTTYIPYDRTVYIDRTVKPYWNDLWLTTSKRLSDNGITLTANNTGSITTTAANYMSTAGGTTLKTSGTSGETFNLSANIN